MNEKQKELKKIYNQLGRLRNNAYLMKVDKNTIHELRLKYKKIIDQQKTK